MTKPKTKPAPAPAPTTLLDPSIPDTDTPPDDLPATATAPPPPNLSEGEHEELPPDPPPAAEEYEIEILELTLRIPFDRSVLNRPGYIGRRHDIKLNEQQAKALRCVTFALDQQEESTRDGKPIRMRDRNTLCWILDQLTAEVFLSKEKS